MSFADAWPPLARAGFLLLAVLILNLPFGAWRVRTRRFGPSWWLAIHAPVPLIILLRWALGLPAVFIAASLAGAVLGQLLGGWIFRRESPSKTRSSR